MPKQNATNGRRAIFAFATAVGIFAAVLAWNCLHDVTSDPIHPINFLKIRQGMSIAEVEEILGQNRIYGLFSGYIGPNTWWGRRYIVSIQTDNFGLVANKTITLRWSRPGPGAMPWWALP
jgi:hypothetical protein